MKRLFGTDGMRGEAGRFPLDYDTARTTGRALAAHLALTTERRPHIITGRDTRESGAWLEAAILDGAQSAGAACESAGVITTPGVAFLANRMEADAGIVVSASHNPYADNGIKIFHPSGRKLSDDIERIIEAEIYRRRADATQSEAVAPDDEGATPTTSENVVTSETASHDDSSSTDGVAGADNAAALRLRYLDYLSDEVTPGLQLDGLSLVVDCANGAAYDLAPALFERLNARVHAINCVPDGRNINENCGSLHLEALAATVREREAMLGVAFDGDADRALFVNSLGEIVDGDATLWILANALALSGGLAGGIVVATVMSNIGLELALRERGWHLRRTDVGDKYVLEELLRTNASIGGEQSGHIIFPHESLVGDGMRTTLHLLKAMTESKKTLVELTTGFERYPQILVNVRVREKRPFDDVPAIAEAARITEERLGREGRLLLRYSGTEALARIMIEGKDFAEVKSFADHLAAVIDNEIGT